MRNAITIAFLSILIHHSLCEKHSKLSLHFFWVRSERVWLEEVE
ncbi:hypothetical protein [Wolbachia endosymbiont (group A) of Brachyopa scutellaris]